MDIVGVVIVEDEGVVVVEVMSMKAKTEVELKLPAIIKNMILLVNQNIHQNMRMLRFHIPESLVDHHKDHLKGHLKGHLQVTEHVEVNEV